jgi:hypothetical protein
VKSCLEFHEASLDPQIGARLKKQQAAETQINKGLMETTHCEPGAFSGHRSQVQSTICDLLLLPDVAIAFHHENTTTRTWVGNAPPPRAPSRKPEP